MITKKQIQFKPSFLIINCSLLFSFSGRSQSVANYNLESAYEFINSTMTNDTLTFNLEETTDMGIFTSDTTNILNDSLFNDEDRTFFRQQFAMLGKVKWEAGKITGATIITQAKVNQIFRRSFIKKNF